MFASASTYQRQYISLGVLHEHRVLIGEVMLCATDLASSRLVSSVIGGFSERTTFRAASMSTCSSRCDRGKSLVSARKAEQSRAEPPWKRSQRQRKACCCGCSRTDLPRGD